MSTSSPGSVVESRWRTYLEAAVFLVPALLLWVFATLYLVPRLASLWRKAGAAVPEWEGVTRLATFLMEQGGVVFFMSVGAVLLLLELAVPRWARYRRVVVGTVVVLLNSTVLVGLTALCVSALVLASQHR